MLFWIVLGVVVVLAFAVLGVLVHGVLGAAGRLARELAAAEADVAPVRDGLQDSADRAARLRDARASAG
ncbi:hypothetical protein SAMN04515665_11713 [Blastococcus sp. DSM 46786]|uniref:hypothetical protein n=1 Tax=Blastococcus sp. DSM 46786 TaxID=1798227 RepID=UPI0008BF2802|nr:hypothetical protein [Blastococcus sp. DSM 46786]SEL68708.1 hypothetical protein SAMN04515665_11713 [Blastococcus sp. DSM 46786]